MAGELINAVIGDMNNGVEQTRKKIDELAESNKNLARATIETLTVTRRVSRGGLLGWLGFTKEEVDQEATDIGISIANGIFDAAVQGMLEGGDAFMNSFNSMFERLAVEAALMTIDFQERIARISEMIRDALADGVIDANERAAINAERDALNADIQAKRQQLIDGGIITPTPTTNANTPTTTPTSPTLSQPSVYSPSESNRAASTSTYSPAAPSVQIATAASLIEPINRFADGVAMFVNGARLIWDAAQQGFVVDVNTAGTASAPSLNRRSLRRSR